MKYIYHFENWPKFHWNSDRIAGLLASVRHQQGRLIGKMEELGFHLQTEAVLQTLTEDVVKSSEIEGEKLDREQVRSSLARRLGMDIGGLKASSRNVEGVVEMMLDATQNFLKPLNTKRIFNWHSALFPTGRSGITTIHVGQWRDDHYGPMQVVSGPLGRERTHFEAPPAKQLNRETQRFFKWLKNEKSQADQHSVDTVLKAGIAHLWFVTLHPFDDGNGRIARAITDLMLARSENSPNRFYSMSSQICLERKNYYEILEITQKSNLDITSWLEWFLGCLGRAVQGAETILAAVIKKARFWEHYRGESFNARQKDMINRLLDGFEGKLTSSKWALICKCSQDTAARDIDDLVKRGILTKNPAGGRSTSYVFTY